MRRRWWIPTAVVAAVLVGWATIGTGSGSPRVVVLAASSLEDAAEALAAAWNGDATVSSSGSQVVAQQVRAGAPADILLLADPDIARALADEGVAGAPVTLATNGLSIVVRPELAGEVSGPADLVDLRIVLADERVPLGHYTRQALARLEESGLAEAGTADAVLDAAVSLEDSARLVLAKVAMGEADAAVVYRTDAQVGASRHGLVTVRWPEGADVEAVYTGQVVRGAGDGAVRFLGFLRSGPGRRVWEAFGFGT